MFAPDHSQLDLFAGSAPRNPHRATPKAARACVNAATFCASTTPAPRTILRDRRPGRALRAPQRCLVAELALAATPSH